MALAANAQGKTVGVRANTLIWAEIKALTTAPAGTYSNTYTTQRTWLHWRYSGNLNVQLQSSTGSLHSATDFVSQKFVVDFDTPGCFSLPFDGSIELIGGEGEYRYWLYYHEQSGSCISKSPEEYEPTYHSLRTYVPRTQVYTVPDNHAWILGYRTASTLIDVATGETITPSISFPGTPVQPGSRFTQSAGADSTIISVALF